MAKFVEHEDYLTIDSLHETEGVGERNVVFIIDDDFEASVELLRFIVSPEANLEENDRWQHHQLTDEVRQWTNRAKLVGLAPWALLENVDIRRVYSGGFLSAGCMYWVLRVLGRGEFAPGNAVFLVDHFKGLDADGAAESCIEVLIGAGVDPKRIFSYTIAARRPTLDSLSRLGVPETNYLTKTQLQSDPIKAWTQILRSISA